MSRIKEIEVNNKKIEIYNEKFEVIWKYEGF
jgi:hypothetical protein